MQLIASIVFHRIRVFFGTCLVAVLFFGGEALGQPKISADRSGFTPQAGEGWSAKWVWQKDAGPANTWMCFRKVVDLSRIPSQVEARISVDSKYWLWINGKLVVFEGGLNRGPNPKDGYFDRVEIGSFLKPGKNIIAVLVWYAGKGGRHSVDSGAGGLVFQTDVGGESIASDASWKISVHPAHYGPLEGDQPSGLYAGADIGFDARRDVPKWMNADFDDREWLNATEKGQPPCAPWNQLWERPISQWKNHGLKAYLNEPKDAGSPLVMKLPYAAQITPYLKIRAPAGLKIGIRTDRYTVSGYNSFRAEYITREGVQEFEALGWMFGENVIYDIPAGIEVIDLKFRETGYDAEFSGGFLCNDPFFERFYEKARRTLYSCIRDNYMDCPDRERGQWIGDVCVQVPQAFACLDRKVDALTLKSVRDLILWRTDDILVGLVPGVPHKEYASQSLAAISEYGPAFTYYEHTGDITPVLGSYHAMKAYVNLWQIHPDGRIVQRAKWNDGGKNDAEILETIWYYLALKGCIDAARLTGNVDDIPEFQNRMERISEGFDSRYWKGNAYQSGDLIDDRANAMAVLSGLAGKEKWPAIGQVLISTRLATPYMESFVYRAMFKMGLASEALHRMKGRYAVMVNSSGTTLWEQFRPKEPTSGKKEPTKNHAWAGAPMATLVQDVAGIKPLQPGYQVYQVLPQLGFLEAVSVTVPSVRGEIKVSLKRQDRSFEYDLVSPPSTSAVVGVPRNLGDRKVQAVFCEDKEIWREGEFLEKSEGQVVEENYLKFSLPPGRWKLKALY